LAQIIINNQSFNARSLEVGEFGDSMGNASVKVFVFLKLSGETRERFESSILGIVSLVIPSEKTNMNAKISYKSVQYLEDTSIESERVYAYHVEFKQYV
jgi:hypothetical protein